MKSLFTALALVTLVGATDATAAAKDTETVLVSVRDKSGQMIHIEVVEGVPIGGFPAPREGSGIPAQSRKDRPDIPEEAVSFGTTIRVGKGRCYITARIAWKAAGIAEQAAGYAPLTPKAYKARMKNLQKDKGAKILKHGCL